MKKAFLILTIACACLGALGGCTRRNAPAANAAEDVDYYTCTMHPSVHSEVPGKCPICGMDLVPVKKAGAASSETPRESGTAGEAGTHEFEVPLDRQQLIGVTYAEARRKPLHRTIRAAGIVSAESGKQWDYVSRVDGYVQDLKIESPGQRVRKGDVLMDLYSPEFVSTEQELVDLLRMRDQDRTSADASTRNDAERLLAAARARLSQWNVPAGQVERLEKARVVEPFLALESPFDGIVEDLPARQGGRVSAGDRLVDLADLSSVWVWAEVYENELPSLRAGLPVTIRSSSDPSLAVSARIALVDPFVNGQTRTGKVRIDAPNADGRLRPGAFVDVTLSLEEKEGLTVPVGAVLPTGEHDIVFVDKGSGRLEPRFVQIGGKFGDDFEVTGGLRAGERVVSSANFLIDAEAKVQGALRDF